jgi:regulator of replication initiation timing
MQEALAAAQAQLAELQKQLAEDEAVRRGLDAELARLRRQLAEEQSERGALEEQLVQHLEESEDFMAQVGPGKVCVLGGNCARQQRREPAINVCTQLGLG